MSVGKSRPRVYDSGTARHLGWPALGQNSKPNARWLWFRLGRVSREQRGLHWWVNRNVGVPIWGGDNCYVPHFWLCFLSWHGHLYNSCYLVSWLIWSVICLLLLRQSDYYTVSVPSASLTHVLSLITRALLPLLTILFQIRQPCLLMCQYC